MGALLFGVLAGPTLPDKGDILEGVDGLELRLDFLQSINLQELKSFISHCGHPVMLTLRRKDQGGRFQGEEKRRLLLLESLCGLGASYVDLEFDVPLAFRQQLFHRYPQVAFVSSYHDFTGTPEDLEEVYKQVKTPHAHIYKIAVTAHSSLDALKVLEFTQSHSRSDKIIAIAMGSHGQPTRILAPVAGAFLTYAPLGKEHTTAEGQLTARELRTTYRFPKLNPKTQVFCLIGDPVDKSMGHFVHNAVFEGGNINAVYIKMLVKKEEIPAFFAKACRLPFKGFSITMPHKEAILPQLTQSSLQVKRVGACNTIDVVNRTRLGYNTDGIGALNALEKKQKVKGRHLVFVGAGGAAKAIALEARDRGAKITILNRSPQKAIDLALVCDGRGGGWELFPEVCSEGYDAIVNCIPEGDLIESSWILPGTIAMDIVYVPKETPFLLKAKAKGCPLIFGYEMFLEQALEQEKIWFPREVDKERAYAVMQKEIQTHL